MSDQINFDALKQKIRDFSKARDWEEHHTPKNVLMAMSVEVGELLEIYQWASEAQSEKLHLDPDTKSAIAQEVADVLLYLTCFADLADINLNEAVTDKMKRNAIKYPAVKHPAIESLAEKTG